MGRWAPRKGPILLLVVPSYWNNAASCKIITLPGNHKTDESGCIYGTRLVFTGHGSYLQCIQGAFTVHSLNIQSLCSAVYSALETLVHSARITGDRSYLQCIQGAFTVHSLNMQSLCSAVYGALEHLCIHSFHNPTSRSGLQFMRSMPDVSDGCERACVRACESANSPRRPPSSQ